MPDEQINAALKEVGAEWLMDHNAERCQARAICHVVDAAVAAERERWRSIRDKLQADIDRPGGRWGMHGHGAVDDDYFRALEYVVDRMDDVLGRD